MSTEKKYWMFRSTGTSKRNPKFCLENNVVTYGWSQFKLAEDPENALEKIKEVVREVVR